MSQTQTIRVTTPDDMELPEPLIRRALERYLQDGDRWRHVEIEIVQDGT